jgi:hypothetical protein
MPTVPRMSTFAIPSLAKHYLLMDGFMDGWTRFTVSRLIDERHLHYHRKRFDHCYQLALRGFLDDTSSNRRTLVMLDTAVRGGTTTGRLISSWKAPNTHNISALLCSAVQYRTVLYPSDEGSRHAYGK